MSLIDSSVVEWTLKEAHDYCVENFRTGCAYWCPLGFCGNRKKQICETLPFRWPVDDDDE